MPHILVSGIGDLIDPVADALRTHGSTVVVVGEVAEVAAAAAEAGPRAFDGYVQLPARFGLMARYPAMSAALPALAPGSRIAFVPAVLPAEVATDDDVEARAALLRVLARAARADGPEGLRVQFLGSGATPNEIAVSVLGLGPKQEEKVPVEPDRSYADWRVELLGMMSAHG